MSDGPPIATPERPPEGIVGWLGEALTRICLAIAGLALLCIVVINGANVVARYIFGSPFSWAEELMLWLMILGVFTGALAVTWRNLHIRIDTFVERWPPPARRAAFTVSSLVCIGVMGTVMWWGFDVVSLLQEMDQRSDALRFPIWVPQSFVPIGLGLMCLIIAIKLLMSRFGKTPQ